MKIAYLLFAYKNPKLIQRAIDALHSANSGFFLHIDKKSDLRDFEGIRGQNVFFTKKRFPVYWAEFSGVRAIMLLIEQALASQVNYEYFVLLSGSEYPIKSRDYIERFFEANKGDEFIRLIKVPAPGKPLSRFTTVRYESNKPLQRLASKALAKAGFAQRDYRKFLGNLELYSGRTWWALTREACEFITQFEKNNPHVTEFFKDTIAPEESFIHTVLGNSEFGPRTCGNLVYEDWSASGNRPEMINENHLMYIESCEKVFDLLEGSAELLFARKFSDESLGLLPKIDEIAARKGDVYRAQ